MSAPCLRALLIMGLGLVLASPSSVAQTEGPLEIKPRRPRPTRTTQPPPLEEDRPVLKRKGADSPGSPAASAEPGVSACPEGFIAVAKHTAGDEAPPRLTRGTPSKETTQSDAARTRETDYECVFSETTVSPEGKVVEARGGLGSLDPLLAKVREQVFDFAQELPDFLCEQLTSRLVSSGGSPREWDLKDRITAEVMYVEGTESYRNLRRNGRKLRKAPEETGAWSTGEFGTLIQDVFSPLTNAAFTPRGNEQIYGVNTKVYDFKVEQKNSHWHVRMEGHEIFPAYDGTVWIDPVTYQVRRIEMKAKDLPSDFPMDTVETTTNYGPVRISGQQYLLTTNSATLSCQRASPYCSRNELEFRDYRKFAAESTVMATESSVTFEGEAKPPEEKKEEKKP